MQGSEKIFGRVLAGRQINHLFTRLCALGVALWCVLATATQASTFDSGPKIAVTMRPIHSLTAAIMQGVATPILILDQMQSAHDAALRPSQMRHIQDADLIIWIGPGAERQLTRPINRIARDDHVLTLAADDGIFWLALDEGAHNHDDHEGHDDHADHDDHHAGARDWHIWLDADNAIVMVRAIMNRLVILDAENAPIYRANSDALIADLRAIDQTLAAGIRPGRYIAEHDAYGYFARRYGWQSAGALTRGHETTSSVADVRRIKTLIANGVADCVVSDPATNQASVKMLRAAADIPVVTLDPIGWGLEEGPALFGELLLDLGASLADCHK